MPARALLPFCHLCQLLALVTLLENKNAREGTVTASTTSEASHEGQLENKNAREGTVTYIEWALNHAEEMLENKNAREGTVTQRDFQKLKRKSAGSVGKQKCPRGHCYFSFMGWR